MVTIFTQNMASCQSAVPPTMGKAVLTRRLLNVLTALSLLPCVAAVALRFRAAGTGDR